MQSRTFWVCGRERSNDVQEARRGEHLAQTGGARYIQIE
jgi:hypothetical protein